MSFRRKFASYRRRSSYRGRGRSSKLILRRGKVMPDTYMVKLRFSQGYHHDATASVAFSAYIYRGNSIFDPIYASGTGQNQPLGRDQLAQLYQWYTVLGSSIKVHVVDQNGDGIARIVGVTPVTEDNVANWASGNLSPREQPYGKWFSTAQANIATNGGNYRRLPVLKSYMSSNKIFGTTKQKIKDEDGYSAAFTTNPTTQWLWYVWFDYMIKPGSNQGMIFDIQVDITYYCKLWDPLALVTG